MRKDEARLIVVGQTTSTNELAIDAVADDAPHGTVYVADAQSEGRGRRDVGGERRSWFSPPRRNLYMSVIARPDLPLDRVAPITLAVGAALADMLQEKTGVDLWLKWPNDLYVDRQKLGGVLTEGVTGPGGLEAVVIGLGLNVNVEADEFPKELRPLATSLRAETGELADRLDLALNLSQAILAACGEYESQGLEGFSGRLERFDRLPGRPVRVRENGAFRRGVARGIGMGGGLRVEFKDGQIVEIQSGEVQVEGIGNCRD